MTESTMYLEGMSERLVHEPGTVSSGVWDRLTTRRPVFDPCQELSPLARRLLKASNALHSTGKYSHAPGGCPQPLPFFSGIPRRLLLPKCRG